MHRATPANSSFRAYSAGGARATIDSIDPMKLMQEIGASIMKGEKRRKIEAPAPYGFAAVPFDADKGEDGKPGLGPETFIAFMGGNRSFPVAGPIDDRRHRMVGMEKGDVALFKGKDDGQQFHMNEIGTFLSSFPGKKLRLQIVQKAKEAAQAAGAPTTLAEAGGGSNGAQQRPTGQKPVYKNESTQFFEVGDDGTESVNKKQTIMLDDGTAVHLVKEGGVGKVYLGGLPGEGRRFAAVMTADGPSTNVFARVA